MPKRKSVPEKGTLKKEIPLLYLLLLLIVVLSLGFMVVVRKYFILKIRYEKLIEQTQTIIVKMPQEKMVNK